MYRIELASGEETVFRTIEELATAIRNGVVNTRARIYHNASQKWLPIEFHPHYRRALEIPAAPAQPAESGPLRAPDFRSSGPQPAVTPAQPAPVQQPPTPVPQQPSPVQHEPAPVQHRPTPVQHQQPNRIASHRLAAEPYLAPAPHHPTPVQQHDAPVQHASARIPIPPPVPSPVLQLTRPGFNQPNAQPIFPAPEVGLALEELPAPPAAPDEVPPPTPQSSRSWIRGPIKLAVIGVLAIVCTRVVVSAAAPGSESRSLAETAPRPAAQPTTPPASAVSAESEPRPVMTAGPAFSPAIVTTAQAAQAPASSTTSAVHAAASHPAPAGAPMDSVETIDPVPPTLELALPDVPRTDSLARTATTTDSSAMRRILRAVTGSKPGSTNPAQ